MRARMMIAALLVLLAAGGVLVVQTQRVTGTEGPPYAAVRTIVDRHCVPCHSARPVVAAFPLAPAGVELDTAEQLHAHAERVRARTQDGTMPLLNKTGMSAAERRTLTAWVDAGARTGDRGD